MGIPPHHAEPPLRQVNSEPHHSRHFRSGMWQKLHNFFSKDDPTQSPIECTDDDEQWPQSWLMPMRRQTRLNHETPPPSVSHGKRHFRLRIPKDEIDCFPLSLCHAERRAVSSTRHVSTSFYPDLEQQSSPTSYWDPLNLCSRINWHKQR